MLDVEKCVKNCMEKYGLSRENAERIARADNILLSIDELRYKYDDENIGKFYPDWLTPEEHLRMCYATVDKKYNRDYFWFNDRDDIAFDLFIYSSIHLHGYKDIYQLNGLLLCRLKNLTRDYYQEQQCYAEPYNWEDESIDSDDNNNFSYACDYDALDEDVSNTFELLSTIKSIKNYNIKGILLLCGYFLADIQEFLEPLVDFYNGSSKLVKKRIYDLGRDDYDFCKSINKKVDLHDKVNITVGRVLKVFNERSKSYLSTDLLPYLKSIGLAS